MNKTIIHYKKTISKDEATAQGLFGGRKTAGCVKPLAMISCKKV